MKIDNLHIEKDYKNTGNWKNADDEFNKFFRFKDGKGIKNMGGFRLKSKTDISNTNLIDFAFCVVVTNFKDKEWPDLIDKESGTFVYYGDNKIPGNPIDQTPLGGNKFLEKIFNDLHEDRRKLIPPVLCFESLKIGDKAFMKFLGLAAPGGNKLSAEEDLTGIWKLKDGNRFQNYRSIFTILDEAKVNKLWLEDIVSGLLPIGSVHCPKRWKEWVNTGLYRALEAKKEISIRLDKDQKPINNEEELNLNLLKNELNDREFEFAALEIVKYLSPNFKDLTVTPKAKDQGRDVMGKYYLGHSDHKVSLDVSVEAKFWKSNIGVKPLMRLISRLKDSDIGIFITSSSFSTQIQKEIADDDRPIILICGIDIIRILKRQGLSNEIDFKNWIQSIKQKTTS